MENLNKRRSLEEIYADIDKVNKRKPTAKQIEDLGNVIRKINEEDQAEQAVVPDKKIAGSTEIHDH